MVFTRKADRPVPPLVTKLEVAGTEAAHGEAGLTAVGLEELGVDAALSSARLVPCCDWEVARGRETTGPGHRETLEAVLPVPLAMPGPQRAGGVLRAQCRTLRPGLHLADGGGALPTHRVLVL